jgi:oxygen-dependent protoporphyrinogen oxidase
MAGRVLVVGGGIAGLSAAVDLVDDASLTVELWEASDRLGGKIASSRFAGLDHIDEGADAFLTRIPHAVEFADRLGVTDLTAPTAATAAVWHNGLHTIPNGVLLGIPASILPFITTGLLSWTGKLRAALEPFLPPTDPDDSIGRLVRARFGDQVHERLVDALVGSIYATDTDRSSLAAVPQLAALAATHRSLLLGARAARRSIATAAGAPIFGAPRAGMASLVDAAGRYIADRGGTVTTSRSVISIEPGLSGWSVDGEAFDAVILATPGQAAAPLLTHVAPPAARILGGFEHADIVMVRLGIPAPTWPDRLRNTSGYLVPKPDQRYVTAASFGSQKWDHWRTADGTQILRVSLGRDGLPVNHLDDDEIIAATLSEVGRHLEFDLQPTEISITRWPDAFPQYRPHHHQRVDALEAALPPTVTLAGASYRGIGIPACVADGQRAARRIKQAIANADGLLS